MRRLCPAADALTLPLSAVPSAAPPAAGGDGPKMRLLERTVSEHGLQGRVVLAGAVPHAHARNFLVHRF